MSRQFRERVWGEEKEEEATRSDTATVTGEKRGTRGTKGNRSRKGGEGNLGFDMGRRKKNMNRHKPENSEKRAEKSVRWAKRWKNGKGIGRGSQLKATGM